MSLSCEGFLVDTVLRRKNGTADFSARPSPGPGPLGKIAYN